MSRIVGRFARVEPRLRAKRSVLGLLSDLPRKNCWTTIAERVGEATPHRMQHLLCRVAWDAEAVSDDVREGRLRWRMPVRQVSHRPERSPAHGTGRPSELAPRCGYTNSASWTARPYRFSKRRSMGLNSRAMETSSASISARTPAGDTSPSASDRG